MAAQAVDFTISGHVNRALVIVDADNSMRGEVLNNTSSSTRVRWTGSSEMDDGTSVGIQVEYQEEGRALGLRHANVNYAGEFGKITIGQGSEAGDGSAYKGSTATFGVGHGQEKGSRFTLGSYFGSLDAGGRTNNLRYDTPAIGPVSAAVSVGNDDRISAAASISSEFGGSSFNATIASLRVDSEVEGKAEKTYGASFGVSMAGGLAVSGAWARGDNHGSTAAVAADAAAGTEAAPAMPGTDPSYFQAAVGYNFGDSTISASWYNSKDFVTEGSQGTAIGAGVNHNLPKVGAQVYMAVQNYKVKKMSGAPSDDETVFVVGTRVKF